MHLHAAPPSPAAQEPHLQQWCRAPVRTSSSSTRTPTSMELVKVRLTMAAISTTEPTCRQQAGGGVRSTVRGLRKAIALHAAARPINT